MIQAWPQRIKFNQFDSSMIPKELIWIKPDPKWIKFNQSDSGMTPKESNSTSLIQVWLQKNKWNSNYYDPKWIKFNQFDSSMTPHESNSIDLIQVWPQNESNSINLIQDLENIFFVRGFMYKKLLSWVREYKLHNAFLYKKSYCT